MASVHEVIPTEVQVRLVAQHAFEYFCLHANHPRTHAALSSGRHLSGGRRNGIGATASVYLTRFPYELTLNLVTASSGSRCCLPSLAIFRWPRTYPRPTVCWAAIPSPSRVLAWSWTWRRWSSADGRRYRSRIRCRFERIEGLDDDGTIWFTSATVDALTTITGARHEKRPHRTRLRWPRQSARLFRPSETLTKNYPSDVNKKGCSRQPLSNHINESG